MRIRNEDDEVVDVDLKVEEENNTKDKDDEENDKEDGEKYICEHDDPRSNEDDVTLDCRQGVDSSEQVEARGNYITTTSVTTTSIIDHDHDDELPCCHDDGGPNEEKKIIRRRQQKNKPLPKSQRKDFTQQGIER